jgi:hypothetical protein
MPATHEYNAEVVLGIEKPSDIRKPVTVAISVELDGIGRVDIELTEHEFVHLLGGTHIALPAQWRSSEEL